MNKLMLVLATTELLTVPCERTGLVRHGLETGVPTNNSLNIKVTDVI